MKYNELKFIKPESTDTTVLERKVITELLFVIFIGLVAIGALYESLTNSFIAYRAPLVILVPLTVLIAIHGYNIFKQSSKFLTMGNIVSAVSGADTKAKSMIGIVCWMLVLLLVIFLAGHFVGVSLFIFLLMRLSRESKALSVKVAIGTTFVIYCLFELVLNIELYRGIIYMLWQGYTIF